MPLVLCVSVVAVGCGEDTVTEGASGAARLKACLRDSGAKIDRLPALRVSHAPYERERFRAELSSGSAAVARVFTSAGVAQSEARKQRRAAGAAILVKGEVLLSYWGAPVGTTVLEDCLRASQAGDGPVRGEIARQLRRIGARRQASLGQYRTRQYQTPQEISQQLRRLRSYRRYRLYYLGERYGRLPLTGIVSKLQPPAYAQSVKRLPRPSSPTFAFIYGNCTPPPDREGGCSPPLSVLNFEICAVSPKSHGVRPSALTQRIRGVPILSHPGAGSLNVFSGKTTVTIFGAAGIAAQAARDLRSIDGDVAAASTLPRPVSGALEGRLRCRPPDDD